MNILTLMETFAVVVETGSFTKAAEQLNLSKSFVSKQVTQLERDLGARLLYRTTRKLNLSDEGKQFYDHCKAIIEEAQSAKAQIMESHSNPRGTIRITVPQSLLISGAGNVLLEFQQQYPAIELEIMASGRIEDLIENSIDVALRIGQLEDSTLISRRLANCMFNVVASDDYLQKYGIPESPAQLVEHNCIVYGDSRLGRNWPFRLKNDESITVKVNGNFVCHDGHLIVDAALKGVGISFGPDLLFKQHLNSGQLKLVLENYYHRTTTISALYPLNKTPSRRLRLLLDYLVEHLPKNIGG